MHAIAHLKHYNNRSHAAGVVTDVCDRTPDSTSCQSDPDFDELGLGRHVLATRTTGACVGYVLELALEQAHAAHRVAASAVNIAIGHVRFVRFVSKFAIVDEALRLEILARLGLRHLLDGPCVARLAPRLVFHRLVPRHRPVHRVVARLVLP